MIDAETVEALVSMALTEDVGEGDITAQLIDSKTQAAAEVITREEAVICGVDFVEQVFKQVDPKCKLTWSVKNGDSVKADQILFQVSGSARSLLTAERTALNFLQILSGTATLTHRYAQKIAHTKCKLLDTRKTLPGLRLAQKRAVLCGGGKNHRLGLYDAFLIKENHIAAAGSIAKAVLHARQIDDKALLEVEVETFDQLAEALKANVDRIMLDNFELEQMRKAVDFVKGQVPLEASGNISLETIADVAETGVNFISVGAITKNIEAVDLSMRFK